MRIDKLYRKTKSIARRPIPSAKLFTVLAVLLACSACARFPLRLAWRAWGENQTSLMSCISLTRQLGSRRSYNTKELELELCGRRVFISLGVMRFAALIGFTCLLPSWLSCTCTPAPNESHLPCHGNLHMSDSRLVIWENILYIIHYIGLVLYSPFLGPQKYFTINPSFFDNTFTPVIARYIATCAQKNCTTLHSHLHKAIWVINTKTDP